jgi:hypothetical protein
MRIRERTLVGSKAMDVPEVIPPQSIVVLRAADQETPAWKNDVGRRFRVGYYSRQDGLDCIWLVNDAGDYEQTTDRRTLLKYFSLEKLSKVRDHFGESRPPLRALRSKTPRDQYKSSRA